MIIQLLIMEHSLKSELNKTKYTMDPRIYYLLEADEDNTNSY